MRKRLLSFFTFAVIGFVLSYSGIFSTADSLIEDVVYHRSAGTAENIKIIKIDERSMSALGDYESWDRNVYADLVEALCVSDEIRPAVIGFDILFSGDRGDEADERFARICGENGNVVCAFSYVFEREAVSDEYGNLIISNMGVSDTVKPYPALYGATRHGFANALMDSNDGLIRSSFLYYDQKDGERELSFNTMVYTAYREAVGIEPTYPADMEKSAFSFRYSGGPGDYENISLCDILDGTVPAEAFDGCIVLVGAYSAGMMDSYYVPVDRGQQMYGVEIHANVIQALMEQKYLTVLPSWGCALITALLSGILAVICAGMRAAGAAVACSAFAIARFGAGYLLFNAPFGDYGYSADILPFIAAAVIIAVFFIALHYYSASRAKREIERVFKKYVAPEVVRKIAKSGTYELKLGGENRDIAVLFVDIRGFTPLSESLEPEQVVEILNSYLKLTTTAILDAGGTLDKFIGDATMAVFNAPFDTEDYVFRSVSAAMEIVAGGEAIEKEFAEKYGKRVGFGVGVNCGPAVVGNIGCDFRMDYTAIGDTVNTAARLEANAPRGKVYVSGEVYKRLGDRISVEEVGEIPLKGKSKGVFVYSVTGIDRNEAQNEEADNT